MTRILSNIKKSQGDLNAAGDILCELQVETFGSMTRREKTEFILEQVSLCIERGDWTQASILIRKINKRYFNRKPKKSPEELEKLKKQAEEREKTRGPDEPPMEVDDDVTDLKLRYYDQQITLANHDYKYLEVCKHYREVLDTEAVENNPEHLRAVCSPCHQMYMTRANWEIDPRPHCLLYCLVSIRQRAVRPAAPHPTRPAAISGPRRGPTDQAVHHSRADALAHGCGAVRPSPMQHRRV